MTDQKDDRHDEWNDWKPDWSFKSKKKKTPNKKKTPHDFQEQHSPTKTIKLKLSTDKSITKHEQRIIDARLWGAMSSFQQNSALAVDMGFQLMSRGLGYKISSPQLINIGSSHNNSADKDSEIISTYFEWAKLCGKAKYHHSAAIDVLVYGVSCQKSDRNRRVRNGWSKKNLLNCLNIYCKMRGWPIK